jgi:hypothetical protein
MIIVNIKKSGIQMTEDMQIAVDHQMMSRYEDHKILIIIKV